MQNQKNIIDEILHFWFEEITQKILHSTTLLQKSIWTYTGVSSKWKNKMTKK